MESIEIPEDAALVLIVRAREQGAQVDLHINGVWREANTAAHRQACFDAGVLALQEIGRAAIPDKPPPPGKGN